MLARLAVAVLLVAGCEASQASSSEEEALTCDVGGAASLANACVKSDKPINNQTALPLSTNWNDLSGVTANVLSWGVHLSSVSGHYEGSVGFDPPETGTYEVYLSSNPPLHVSDRYGTVYTPSCSSSISSTECDSLRHVGTYQFTQGKEVRFDFGPTTVSYVRMHIQTVMPTPAVCTADELTEETAACEATSAGDTPLTANTLQTLGFVDRVTLAPGTAYGVKLPAVSGGYGGWVYINTPGNVELYLGTPNIPLRIFNYGDFNDTHTPPTECSRYIASSECGKLRRGTRLFGGTYRIEFGPSASSYVRVELREVSGSQGSVSFGPPQTYAAGATGYYVTPADLDADGAVDLVESSPDDAAGRNEVHVLRGTGTGAFTDVSTTATSAPAETVVSDFSGDGIADIAGIAWDGMGPLPDFYLQGQGSLAYAKSTWGDGRDFNGTLSGGDFDEDGTLDLVAPYFGGFVILKMPGFVVVQDVPAVGDDTVKAVAGDFDGDGHQDVVVGSAQSNVVHLYRGNGSGTVTLTGDTTLPGGNISGLKAFDLDRDGRSDLVAIHFGGTSIATVSYGTTAGLATAQIIPLTSTLARGLAAGDFDSDGRLDLAIGYTDLSGGSVEIWRNATGGFTRVLTLNPTSGVGWGLGTGDFNGDGVPDLAVPGLDAVTIYLATP